MPLSLWGLGRLALARLAAPGAGHIILTIVGDGELCTVTTAAPHGLAEAATVTISGNSVSVFNGASGSITVLSAETFAITNANVGTGTGGRWA